MTRALEAARASGLVRGPLVVMLSGGADSVCLLDVAVKLGADVSALHCNYGLRGEEADGDEAFCRELCREFGVPLRVERVALPNSGNLQAAARDARYALAERHAAGDYAAAHTASDQAETVLMRLAAAPGRRALLGMEPRRGRLVRPLLEATRADTRAHCEAAGLRWREDSSNADPRFTRTRARELLRALGPAAEETIAETARQLRDEAEVLDRVVEAAATDELAALRELPPALARLVMRREAGAHIPRARVEEILALQAGSLDLGGGLRAVVEHGRLRFARGPEPAPPEPVVLAIPGSTAFGDWQVEAAPAHEGLSTAALGPRVTVRAWRDGDRIRVAGGTKTLQDLFTDRKVPREQRRSLPVVEANGEVAWVAGLAAAEPFRGAGPAVRFDARRRET